MFQVATVFTHGTSEKSSGAKQSLTRAPCRGLGGTCRAASAPSSESPPPTPFPHARGGDAARPGHTGQRATCAAAAALTPTGPSPGFTFPTGPVKPEESGSGIPVRFGRLPVGTGQIQI